MMTRFPNTFSDSEGHEREEVGCIQHGFTKCCYQDVSIALEAMSGFPLAGWLPSSAVFPTVVKPPEVHSDELAMLANSYTARTQASVRSPEDLALSHELWDITMEEVEASFLDGPFVKFRFAFAPCKLV